MEFASFCSVYLFPLQFEKLGYSRPLINLPVPLVYSAGSGSLPQICASFRYPLYHTCLKIWWVVFAANSVHVYPLFQAVLVEYLHILLRPVIKVPLLFTRSEVIMLPPICLFKAFFCSSDFKWVLEMPHFLLLTMFFNSVVLNCHTVTELMDTWGIRNVKKHFVTQKTPSDVWPEWTLCEVHYRSWRCDSVVLKVTHCGAVCEKMHACLNESMCLLLLG